MEFNEEQFPASSAEIMPLMVQLSFDKLEHQICEVCVRYVHIIVSIRLFKLNIKGSECSCLRISNAELSQLEKMWKEIFVQL